MKFTKMTITTALVCTLLLVFGGFVGGLEAIVCINADVNQAVQIEGANAYL